VPLEVVYPQAAPAAANAAKNPPMPAAKGNKAKSDKKPPTPQRA